MNIGSGLPLAPIGALALLLAPILFAGPEFLGAGAVKMYVLELGFVAVTVGLALATALRGK